MKRKMVMLDSVTHRELDILAARKCSSMTAEARLAVTKHIQIENKKLERGMERKGAA